jgi:hypothetical protein
MMHIHSPYVARKVVYTYGPRVPDGTFSHGSIRAPSHRMWTDQGTKLAKSLRRAQR